MPLGSNVPVFHLVAAAQVLTPAAGPARTLAKKWWWLALAAYLSVATLSRLRTAAIDQFWQPLVQSNSPVSLCVTRTPIESEHGGDIVNLASRSSSIDWPDVVTLEKLTGLLQAKGLRYEIRGEDQTSFNDLRKGPAILIGGFKNSWTLRLMNQGRFSLQRRAYSAGSRTNKTRQTNDGA